MKPIKYNIRLQQNSGSWTEFDTRTPEHADEKLNLLNTPLKPKQALDHQRNMMLTVRYPVL